MDLRDSISEHISCHRTSKRFTYARSRTARFQQPAEDFKDLQKIVSSSLANCIRRKAGTMVKLQPIDNRQHRHLPLGENDSSTATCLRRCKISHLRIWMLRINIKRLNACPENDFGNPTKIETSFFRRLDNISSSPTLQHKRSYKDLASFLQTIVDTFTTLGFH